MKSLLITFCFFLVVNFSFSQKDIYSLSKTDFNDEKISLIKPYFLDSSSAIAEITYRTPGFSLVKLFYIELTKDNKFEFLELEPKGPETTIADSYCKIENIIYRLRSETDKGNIHFYFDKLNGISFNKETHPFLSGEKSKFGAIPEIYPNFSNSSFLFVTSDQAFMGSNSFTIHELKKSTYEVVFSKDLYFSDKLMCRNWDFIVKEEKFFTSFVFVENKVLKSKIVYYEKQKLNEFNILSEDAKYLQDSEIISNENEILFSIVYKKDDETPKSQLFKLDLKNIEAQLLSSVDISFEQLSTEYPQKKSLNFLLNRRCFFYKSIVDAANDNLYIIYRFENSELNWANEDIIISKVSNNKINWTQVVRLTPRSPEMLPSPVSFKWKITEQDLTIYEYEREKMFSEGQFVIDKKVGFGSGNEFTKISIVIDSKSGNVSRKMGWEE